MEYIPDSVVYTTAIVAIVLSIYQIALSFKIWGMTNTIKRIDQKMNHPCGFDIGWEIRKSLLKGDKKVVEDLLFDEFIYDIKLKCAGQNECSDEEIAELKSNYAQYYEQIGSKLPESIQNLKSKKDFYKVFTFSI